VTERPLRADARRNREKVLRAAREAFATSGFGVPLDEIAARAGVGPGTVYRHFPTKEALFEAVMTARVEDLIADARARAGAAGPGTGADAGANPGTDPGTAFFGFLARIGQEAAVKRDLSDAIAIPGTLRDELYAALDLLLRRAQQAGAVRADITAPELIALLKGVLMGIHDVSGAMAGASGGAQGSVADPAGLPGRLLAILSDGLRPPSA
jgi:AcrR family transcriptional regulator